MLLLFFLEPIAASFFVYVSMGTHSLGLYGFCGFLLAISMFDNKFDGLCALIYAMRIEVKIDHNPCPPILAILIRTHFIDLFLYFITAFELCGVCVHFECFESTRRPPKKIPFCIFIIYLLFFYTMPLNKHCFAIICFCHSSASNRLLCRGALASLDEAPSVQPMEPHIVRLGSRLNAL